MWAEAGKVSRGPPLVPKQELGNQRGAGAWEAVEFRFGNHWGFELRGRQKQILAAAGRWCQAFSAALRRSL